MDTNKNGLPIEIKYCKKCNLINQRPTSINEYFHIKETRQKTIEFDTFSFTNGDACMLGCMVVVVVVVIYVTLRMPDCRVPKRFSDCA